MCCPDRSQFTVDLDQADQQGHALKRLSAVSGMGKLIQVVPDPRKLPQQFGRYLGSFAPLPQAQTAKG